MNLINPNVRLILPNDYTLKGIYKMVELAGRTCYKSEMSSSPKEFVERMIKSGHGAMLEHGTIYLDIPIGNLGDDPNYMWKSHIIQFFKKNRYSRVKSYRKSYDIDKATVGVDCYAVTTNLRVFEEQIDWVGEGPMRREKLHGWELGMDREFVLSFLCEPNEHHDKRITFKITCDRGVSHELVRHRVFSFAQESTRYCNYSKDKFNSELTFIIPSHMDLPEGRYIYWDGDWCDPEKMTVVSPNADETNETNTFLYSLTNAENDYMYLINHGWKPQQARAILPNALKTELIMTGYEDDWKQFLQLRYEGTTGAPHPDMKVISTVIHDVLI